MFCASVYTSTNEIIHLPEGLYWGEMNIDICVCDYLSISIVCVCVCVCVRIYFVVFQIYREELIFEF